MHRHELGPAADGPKGDIHVAVRELITAVADDDRADGPRREGIGLVGGEEPLTGELAERVGGRDDEQRPAAVVGRRVSGGGRGASDELVGGRQSAAEPAGKGLAVGRREVRHDAVRIAELDEPSDRVERARDLLAGPDEDAVRIEDECSHAAECRPQRRRCVESRAPPAGSNLARLDRIGEGRERRERPVGGHIDRRGWRRP